MGKQARKVFGLQVKCKELDIFKIRNFLRNCLEIFSGFFGGIYGFFFDFFGTIFWEDFLGKSANLFESEKDFA